MNDEVRHEYQFRLLPSFEVGYPDLSHQIEELLSGTQTVELILIRTDNHIAEAQQRHHTLQIDIAGRVE